MASIAHVHMYVGPRPGVPALLVWLGAHLGLARFVMVSGVLPHHPDCTADVGVTEAK